jgi:uncharacterized coiled-coil DUF342 family protein
LFPCFGQGGSYDSELIRVLRERDEMQNMLDKYERHLSEIQANVRVLTADRDKTSMHYQQASTILKGTVNSNIMFCLTFSSLRTKRIGNNRK